MLWCLCLFALLWCVCLFALLWCCFLFSLRCGAFVFRLLARLSTGASREAPVDNECLGKCRQVGGDGRRREILIGYWQLG